MSAGKFFTFTLPLLAMKLPEKDLIQHIVSHAIQRAGNESAHIDDADVLQSAADQNLGDFSPSKPEHKRILRGAMVCGVTVGSISGNLRKNQTSEAFINAHENLYGKSPLVFISSELLWGCHDRDEPSFRDFSTICAINSIIGFKKSPVLVRRGLIIARQLGYKTPAVMQAELKKRKDQKPLTVQQLRDTLDRLETRELICRYQASRRNVYFSTTIGYDDLKNSVTELKAKQNKVAIRRELERGNRAGTRTEPQENHLKRETPKQPKKEPLKNEEPEQNQNGTTPGTTGGTTTGTTKRNALKEVSLNKISQTNGEMSGDSFSEKQEPNETELKLPTLEDVIEAACSLFEPTPVTRGMAKHWFNQFGTDTRWLTTNWRNAFAKWALNETAKA